MWPFLLDRTVTINKRMRGTVSQVTEILYDVHEWCRLHPFVNKVEQDPDVPHRYKITDRLSGPWHLWEYDNSIHAVFTRQEDERGRGVNVSVTLPQTTVFPKLENQLRVKETETPGIVEVSEVVEMRALFLLLPYIVNKLTSSHRLILDRLAEKIEGANERDADAAE
ncbi:hypothetical protein AGABI2DRAFT_182365 [Agaricus bisporus var. bisporus H97]|uniref:hypothetical protein n=1 Tax=Agaricus bisporus var. bisporus (strain H97 / ATCC MYA-4626 / FGSC 10389) TaxID=936046 RepID=UPI00029F805D|nr:hypothetical protein AGABI2DRAFT_182365 [Agaricus bisporus var. bisporus H97]EKV51407.1 hypothetical protein AGABI2DRAFT_182365 [Agaricus bisporus var. bisporus H97]